MKPRLLGRLLLVLFSLGFDNISGMDQEEKGNLTVENTLAQDQIIPFSGFKPQEIKDFFSGVPQFLDLKTLSAFSQINHWTRILCYPYKLGYFRNAPPFICPENEIVPILKSLRKIALYERFLCDMTLLEDGIQLKVTDADKISFHTQNNSEITKALNYSNEFDYSVVFQTGQGAAYRKEISTRHNQLLQSGFLHSIKSLGQSVRKDYIYKYTYTAFLVGSLALLCADCYTSRNPEFYKCSFSQSSPNCIQFYGRAPANIIGYQHSQQGLQGCLSYVVDTDLIDQIFDKNCQMMKEAVLWRASITELIYFFHWLGFLCRYIQIFIFR